MRQDPKTRQALASSNVATDDRRAHVRFSCELDSSCSPISASKGMQWTGKVRDVSRGGLGVVLSRRFELGTLLGVEIQEADGTTSGTLLARVVHVTPHSGGGWVIGCCFTSELGDDEVKAFVKDADF